MSLAVVRGTNAADLLEDHGFQREWAALVTSATSATPFVRPALARAWIASMAPTEILVCLSRDAAGRLDGFLPLARVDGKWSGLGGVQSVEHGWLAPPLRGSYFVERALLEIGRHLTEACLTFDTLPDDAPYDWSQRARRVGRLSRVSAARGFVAEIDPTRAALDLSKKGNSTQLKALEQRGVLTTTPATPAELAGAIAWTNTYQAVTAKPALYDGQSAAFFTAVLEFDAVVTSTLQLGGQAASVFFGYVDGPRVILEFLAEDPTLEQWSPAYAHWLLIESALHSRGIKAVDVTRGPLWLTWDADPVDRRQVEVLFEPRARWRRDAQQRFVDLSRWALRRLDR